MSNRRRSSFSAKEESPLDVPNLIIQINLKTKGQAFSGQEIAKAVQEVGLQLGEMQIYHRYTTDGSHKAIFNMASMVEPGFFPKKDMEGFSTPRSGPVCSITRSGGQSGDLLRHAVYR